jgi:glycosyltransferase involved in cell wall biosynthesis
MVTKTKFGSVVVPTSERPALLRGALQSIRALERDNLSFEAIVGDNGSSPDTHLVAEAFNVIALKGTKVSETSTRRVE